MNRDSSHIFIYSKCPFDYFFFPSFYFNFNALINMEKWIGLLYANGLFYRKPTLQNRAVQNKMIKCTRTQPIVQLNHGLIFLFFQVCWEHSSQASYFRNNEPLELGYQ